MLMIVIGYDLVSYLLHYSSARCVTFKELFICKSNNKTGDFDMNLPDFFSISYKFFRKSGFIRRYTIAQKDFERTCADYCISGEKGFASRLSNSLDWWGKAHFFCAYAKEVFLRLFRWFFFFAVLLSRKRKAVYDRLPINGTSRHPQQANREEWFAGGLPGFTLPAMSFFCWGLPFFTDFSFEVSCIICLYFRLPPFSRLSVSRIRQSFPFWAQR